MKRRNIQRLFIGEEDFKVNSKLSYQKLGTSSISKFKDFLGDKDISISMPIHTPEVKEYTISYRKYVDSIVRDMVENSISEKLSNIIKLVTHNQYEADTYNLIMENEPKDQFLKHATHFRDILKSVDIEYIPLSLIDGDVILYNGMYYEFKEDNFDKVSKPGFLNIYDLMGDLYREQYDTHSLQDIIDWYSLT